MRLDTIRRDVESSPMMQTSRAKIAATAKLFDMFANDTYANKPLAIMRETVANGIDAHAKAGCPERPLEVTLPTELDPTCRIRDFGTGMHHDFVMGPFMEYTNGSTKDTDDGQIGGFGIGSKSPLSYVDAFTLDVIHDGIHSIYTLFKAEDGVPEIGLQAQTTTDEPNGVEISFPVEAADVTTFHEAAQEALQYFNPLPIVHNGVVNPPSYTYVGNGWAMRDKAGPLGVIMGGVRYPSLTASFAYDLRSNERLKPLLEYGLDLTLPIGACGVAMSREQLSYTPKTSQSVREALEAVIDDVVDTFSTIFDTAPSLWDAAKMLANETGVDGYNRSARAQLMLSNAKYKGQKLETTIKTDGAGFATVKFWHIDAKNKRRRGGVNVPNPGWTDDFYGITPGRIETLILDDLPRNSKSKTIGRIKQYVEQQLQAKDTLILRGRDEKDVKRLLDLIGNPSDVVYASDLPEPPKIASVKSGAVRPRVRMYTFTGEPDKWTHSKISNLTPAASKDHAIGEIPYASQPQSGIMVMMQSFDLPGDFYKMMDTQLVKYSELYFVNQSDAPKIKANFRTLEEVFQERLKVALSAYPELPEQLAVSADQTMSSIRSDLERFTVGMLNGAQLSRPFGKLVALHDRYIRPLDAAQRLLRAWVDPKLPAGVKPAELFRAFMAKQEDAHILWKQLDLSDQKHRALFLRHA